jgi:hypothetical protein
LPVAAGGATCRGLWWISDTTIMFSAAGGLKRPVGAAPDEPVTGLRFTHIVILVAAPLEAKAQVVGGCSGYETSLRTTIWVAKGVPAMLLILYICKMYNMGGRSTMNFWHAEDRR